MKCADRRAVLLGEIAERVAELQRLGAPATILSIDNLIAPGEPAVANDDAAQPEPECDAPDAIVDGVEYLETWRVERRLGVPQDLLRKWCKRYKIGVKPDGRWLVNVEAARERAERRGLLSRF